MALVRVYCGLASADPSARPASAESPLTVAVVDDAGRLLDVHEVSDDPAGYARLAARLVERSSGSTGVAIAADSDDHLVTSLLIAAGRPLVVADDDAADDYAERFADDDSTEEMQAPPAARRAVGLARALQAGALSAVTLPTPRDLVAYKPVLAAHAALGTGRHSAAIALRDVLRELYPAALRAYPDPAQPVPLAVLETVPEPGLLATAPARGRDSAGGPEAVIEQLVRDGVAGEQAVTAAVTALSVAIAETPRRSVSAKPPAAAIADTVRSAIAAVRACDAGCQALLATLHTRATSTAPAGRRAAGRRAAPLPAPTPAAPTRPGSFNGSPAPSEAPPAAPRVGGRRSRPEPAAASAGPITPQPMTAPPTAPAPIAPPPVAPRPLTAPPAVPAAAADLPARQPAPPTNRPVSAPPPPPPGITPILPAPRSTVPPAENGEPFRPTLTAAAINNARAERRRTVIPPRPNTRAGSEAGSTGNGFRATDPSVPTAPPARPDAPPPGSRANWPLSGSKADDMATPAPGFPTEPAAFNAPAAEQQQPANGRRVPPPWQADDLPVEPPALRLVEPAAPASGALREPSGAHPLDTPPLRAIDTDGSDASRSTRNRRTTTALDRSAPPVTDEGDGDLLIFAQTKSAWFVGHDEEEPDRQWSSLADTGWRAAEQAARPAVGAETSAGLPKRVPQANLVPGSPLREERPLRIVRDAASIAAHTTGYFRGWRRGQEIGGYAIGGRPGREAAGGWDFTRDNGGRDDNREYEYPPASRR